MAKSNANSLIQLSPKFEEDSYRGTGGKNTFQKKDVNLNDIRALVYQLESIQKQYKFSYGLNNLVLSIRYKSVVSKSRRIKRIFTYKNTKAYSCVVGSQYYIDEDSNLKHQVTYFVSPENLKNTIELLKESERILDEKYNGVFKNEYMAPSMAENQKSIFDSLEMSKSCFFDLMCDISNINEFLIFRPNIEIQNERLVSFFSIFDKTEDLRAFLANVGLSNDIKCFDSNTVLIKNDYDLAKLLNEVPYIVSQGLTNFGEYDYEEETKTNEQIDKGILQSPGEEPIIGVFDSYFDETAYFKDWVDCVPCYDKDLYISQLDKIHGTKVCNIIVDGPRHNKWLEDNCGNFRVKLFEVSLNKTVNFDFIFNNLEKIVAENPRIKVWNFSLGDKYSVNMNQISLMGAKIDYVSKKYNVIFVVSGTNWRSDYPNEKRVGSPADSLNALVVNSVDRNGNPAPYTRTGPVLTLYTKPDVSYYGGTKEDPLCAYSPSIDYSCSGTSFAAPWIARKLAYLVHYLHLDPLLAKALIVDSAAGWDTHGDMKLRQKMGYGVVPKDIKDITYCDSDEIRFVISDVTLKYITKITTIPVPFDEVKQKFYYTAKATLCYYTEGERKNGVDYSSIEMEIKFGRNERKISKKTGTEYFTIDSINKDKQYDEDGYVDESKACIEYQKWNNTKHLVKPIGARRVGLEPKYKKYWGISVTQIDRLSEVIETSKKYGLKFAIVVTIKNIYGEDAPIQSFVNECVELKLNPIVLDEAYNIKLYNEENAVVNWKE